MTVLSFLQQVMATNEKNEFNFTVIDDSFRNNWIRSSDIDTLIKLVNSKQKCLCFVSPYSSYLPFKDSADLGGYAIALIESYKEKQKVRFGLYACPKTNKNDADELIKWWSKQN